MKGLLLKDIIFLRSMKNFLLLITAVGIILSLTNNDSGAFALGYITFLGGFLAISSINADRANDGYSFLFSLPITKKDYVTEKYLFAFLTSLLFCAAAVLLLLLFTLFKPEWLIHNILIAALWTIGVSLVMSAVFIPVQLKFQDSRARMVIMIIIGAILAIMIMLNQLSVIDYFSGLANSFLALPNSIIATIAVLVVLIVLLVSYNISLHIMNKKEF